METEKTKKDARFRAVYSAFADEIYRYVYLRTMTDAVAEDLTQDIFVEVYRGLNGFKGLSSERTWVYRIAKNKLADYYRSRYRGSFERGVSDETLEDIADPEQDVQNLQLKAFESEKVRRCLGALTPDYRLALLLKYMDGRSVKEIARFIERTPKAAESLLQRAKRAFIEEYSNAEREEL